MHAPINLASAAVASPLACRRCAACGGERLRQRQLQGADRARRSTTLKRRVGQRLLQADEASRRRPGIVEITLKNIESGIHDLVIQGVPGFQLEVSGDGSTAHRRR